MKMDLEALARIVEERVSTVRATCVPEANQIVNTFTNRIDLEVALLTPYYQHKVASGNLSFIDLEDLLNNLEPLMTQK